ncbi:hypothetical protein IW262DRAFT_695730 [Armillaria fumosa]|nr:hypothetical protein IW262DRAFT_695730 [Armillaria fumosa]
MDLSSFGGLVVHLYSNLLPAPSAPVSRQSLAGFIFSYIQVVLEKAPIATVEKVKKLLKFCFPWVLRGRVINSFRNELSFKARRMIRKGTHLKNILVPMILHLKPILTGHGIYLMEQPCKTFYLTVMQQYTSIIVGKKQPRTIPTALTKFSYRCYYCNDIRTFVKNGVQLTHHVCAVTKVRVHIEEKLKIKRVRIEAAGVE